MNTQAKHTPGPWVSGEYSSGTEVTGRNGKTICFLAVSRSDQSPAADMSRANATLIAAAPAMYEALQQLVKVEQLRTQATLDNDYVDLVLADQQLQTLAQAALAQAEGRDK